MPLTPYHHCNEKIMDMVINNMAGVVGISLAAPVWRLQDHDLIPWTWQELQLY